MEEQNTSVVDDWSDAFVDEGSQETSVEEVVETAPAEETTEEVAEVAGEQTSEPEKMKIVYNKQEVELTKDELIQLAQKGMNYDKVAGKVQELQKSREFDVLDKYAQMYGVDRNAYLDVLQQQLDEAAIQQEVDKGVPPEVAKRLLDLEHAEQSRMEQTRQAEQQQQEKQQFIDFVKEYPDVKEFPSEVIEMMKQGTPPITAYQHYENKMLKLQLEAFTKNNKNISQNVGSVKSAGTAQRKDPALEGWDSIQF